MTRFYGLSLPHQMQTRRCSKRLSSCLSDQQWSWYGQRNTNAFSESTNRQMKDVDQAARSMSFEMFRDKMLFSAEHKIKRKEKPRRESPFTMGNGVSTDTRV